MDPNFFDLQSDPSKTATSLAVGFFDPFDKDSDIVYKHDRLHVRKLIYIIASFYPFIEHNMLHALYFLSTIFRHFVCGFLAAKYWQQSLIGF